MIKRKIAIALAFSTLLSTAAFAAEVPSNENNIVLISETSQSKTDDLISKITDNAKFNDNDYITRETFCEYIYNAANSLKELPVAKLSENPFTDTVNYKINGLNFVGIVSGKGNKTFAPDEKITREEAAVIIYKTAEYLSLDIPLAKVDIAYSDNDKISPWAVSPIYSLKIMDILDRNENTFNPSENLKYKEAVSDIVNLYNAADK